MTSIDLAELETIPVHEKTYRIIPSRFPPIDLYERVASAEEFEILHAVESLTNERLRDEVGDINLVPRADRIGGPGTSFIMAAFTHANVADGGGRFDKGFGVFYCAKELNTALEETKFHRTKFFRDFQSDATRTDMRLLTTDLSQNLFSIVKQKQVYADIYHPSNYSAGQALAKQLKSVNAWGLAYSSVRKQGGTCYGVFRPPALSNCRQSKHYEYYFDGEKISHVAEKKLI